MKKPFCLLLFSFFVSLSALSSPVEHVIIVSVDGLRPDAISVQTSPNIETLKKNGVWAVHAQTIPLSKTLPSHTSMLTGRSLMSHQVTWNTYDINKKGAIRLPTCLEIVKKNKMSSAMFVGKEKFKHLHETGQTFHFSLPGVKASKISSDFVRYVKKNGLPNLTFIHYPEVDYSGHRHGWMSKPYFEALKGVDTALSKVLKVMNNKEYKKNTVIIVTSDHGGEGKTHGEDIPVHRNIPWIASGEPVKSGWAYHKPVKTYDTAATAVALLGLQIPSDWEGKPVGLPLERIKETALAECSVSGVKSNK